MLSLMTIGDRISDGTMFLLKPLLGFFLSLSLIVLLVALPAPALAASSAAIRAYDDLQTSVQDFSGQSLVRSEFGDANLQNANFSQADLRGAVFNGASLANANLHGVDFSDGIAYITNFSGADLRDAIFTSAMLLKSNFQGAQVAGADFSDASIDRDQILKLCQSATGTNPVTGVDTRESLGCR
jgi:uncharacterized protein YjbI with pentapeptide repeats